MKKLTLFCAAILGGSLFAAPQVTPRQMTNYVESVERGIRADLAETKDELEEKIEQAKPSDYDSVRSKANTALQPNDLGDWAKQPTKPTYTAGEVGTYDSATIDQKIQGAVTPADYDSVRSKANSALQPDDIPEWAKQPNKPTYYADEVGTYDKATIEQKLAAITSGEASEVYQELFFEPNNRAYIVVKEQQGQTTVDRVYYFQQESVISNGTFYSLKVLTSTDSNIRKDDCFGGIYAGGTNSRYLNGRTGLILRCVPDYREITLDDGSLKSWNVYNFSGEYTNAGVRVVATGVARADDSVMNPLVNFTLDYYNGNEITRTTSFVGQSIRLGAENWKKATGYQTTDVYTSDFVYPTVFDTHGTEVEQTLTFGLRQIQGNQQTRIKRKLSPIDFFVLSAFAEQYNVLSGFSPQYVGEYHSSWDEATIGYTEEEYTVKPEVVAKPDQWNSISYWDFHIPDIGVTISYVNEFGETVVTTRRIRNEQSLLNLMANIGWSIPPRAEPVWKKKNKKCYKGHIYGADCICTECGEKRQHAFDKIDGYDCWRCANKYTEWERDDEEIKIPVGEKEQQCLAKVDSGEFEKHGGWHHEEVEIEGTAFQCSCECGYYSNENRANQHALPEQVNEYEDLHDGRNHYAVYVCSRSSCQHEVKMKQEHLPDDESPDIRYVPNPENVADEHIVYGICKECRGDIEGLAEGHNFIIGGSGVEKCYCTSCEDYFHKFVGKPCGQFENKNFCARCAMLDGHEALHDFESVPHDVGEDGHQCECGDKIAPHNYPVGKNVCSVCGHIRKVETDNGERCPTPRGGWRNRKPSEGSEDSKDDDPHTKMPPTGENDRGMTTTCDECGGSVADYYDMKSGINFHVVTHINNVRTADIYSPNYDRAEFGIDAVLVAGKRMSIEQSLSGVIVDIDCEWEIPNPVISVWDTWIDMEIGTREKRRIHESATYKIHEITGIEYKYYTW